MVESEEAEASAAEHGGQLLSRLRAVSSVRTPAAAWRGSLAAATAAAAVAVAGAWAVVARARAATAVAATGVEVTVAVYWLISYLAS